MAERYVIAGVAHVRSAWFAEVASWASGGAAALDFMKCVSVAELRARIRAGVTISAALVDASISGIDRDLLSVASNAGVAVIVVADPRVSRDWQAIGAAAVLPPTFTTEQLLTTLASNARPLPDHSIRAAMDAMDPAPEPGFRGNVLAVCGRGGAGTSVIAMALAQGLAASNPSVCLADWTLNGDLAAYHDAIDVIPAVPELIDAHRTASPSRSTTESMLHDVESRGYSLLLGVRRVNDWAAMRPRAVTAALEGLASCYRWTVCDITADLESESDTGCVEIEDRHSLAHSALAAAELVIAVGAPTMKGVRDLVILTSDLVDAGVPADRILHVVNRAPRSGRARSEICSALAELSEHDVTRTPLFLPERRQLELIHRCSERIPDHLAVPLTRAVTALVGSSPVLDGITAA